MPNLICNTGGASPKIIDKSSSGSVNSSSWKVLPILSDSYTSKYVKVSGGKITFKQSPGKIYLNFYGRYVNGSAWSYWIITKNSTTIASQTGNKDSNFSYAGYITIDKGDTLYIQGRSQNTTSCSWTCTLTLLE